MFGFLKCSGLNAVCLDRETAGIWLASECGHPQLSAGCAVRQWPASRYGKLPTSFYLRLLMVNYSFLPETHLIAGADYSQARLCLKRRKWNNKRGKFFFHPIDRMLAAYVFSIEYHWYAAFVSACISCPLVCLCVSVRLSENYGLIFFPLLLEES